ncbi:MAG: branched-chain amino acid ABC transporter permease [Thermodesulfobacteriota bacterium]|nr:branched-chain amino acid ABC transporter permease [Thermodesulfobacteriota bacterium]
MTTRDRLTYFIYHHRTGLSVWALVLVLSLFPFYYDNPYILGITNLVAINVIVVLGLNLFIGYAGQISLGHAAFFGLGAYGSAIFTVYYHIWPWPAMALSALLVALTALIIGVPVLRLSGHYLAMATLGFNIVIYTVLVQWDEVTGGPSGFAGIPPLSIGNLVIDDEFRFHYVVWGVALVLCTLSLNLVRSGVGRGLAALAVDERVAGSLGVNPGREKVKVFILSAVFASLAGSLYAHCFCFVNPDTFGIFASVDFVIMVVVGGMGSIWGSLLGAGLLTVLPEFLDTFETFKDIIHGMILVLILLFLPQGFVTGLLDLIRTNLALRRRKSKYSA